MKKRNWFRITIAMITLIATVLETGFSSVSTLAAEYTTDENIIVNTDAVEEAAPVENDNEGDLNITVESDNDGEAEEAVEEVGSTGEEQEETYEEAGELKNGSLDVSDSGISGSGYDEISIYVNIEGLKKKDRFRLEFEGPASASYNPVINEDLDRTNGGRYDFESLEGGDFTVRATSSDNVNLSYRYNEDGYPEIVVESTAAEKNFTTKTLTATDDTEINAVSGEGYDSVKIRFNTDELSDKAGFVLFVDTKAKATVDGQDATEGIYGLNNGTDSVTIENLDEESFDAYVVAEFDDYKIKTIADIDSVEDGEAVITVDNENVKREYVYEDSKVKVTATLEKADAVPDDAYFCVEPLSEEDAEAYLAALNENRGEDQPEYTAENTLLYDIGFYKDDSKKEEIEPEEGSARLSVEFKNNQLEEDLGAETKEDIEVTHFVEEGSKIEPEKLEVVDSPNVSVVDVVTESFSKFAFTVQGNTKKLKVSNPGNETSTGLLGDAWLYGITANTWQFNGESETSFAVKRLTGPDDAELNGGQTGVNSSKAEGSNYQYSMVGFINGKTVIKGYRAQVTLPSDQKSKLTHESGANWLRFVNRNVDNINSDIAEMITYVQTKSDDLVKKDSGKTKDGIDNYKNLPANPQGNHIYMDITDAKDGTYYISLDNYEGLKNAFKNSGQVHITKNKGQKIVFNTRDESVRLDKFDITQDGTTYQSTGIADMSTAKNPLVEDIIFNMPNATSLHIQDGAGIYLAPKAFVTTGGVAGGWLVAATVKTGCEWHFVNGHLPDPKNNETEYHFEIGKEFNGPWPEEGFTFELESYAGDSNNTGVTVDPKVLPGYTKTGEGENDYTYTKNITVYSTDPNGKKSFGTVKFSARDIYNKGRDVSYYWGGRDVKCMCYMYRIHEVIPDPKDPNIQYDDGYWFLKLWVNAEKINNGNGDEYIVWVEPKTARSVTDGTICEPGDTNPIVFENTYTPVDLPVSISGIKKVNGDDATEAEDGKFSFSLYQYNPDSGKFDKFIQTKQNSGNTVTFDELTLNKDNAPFWSNAERDKSMEFYYYFLIKEENVEAPYKKDDSVYIAKVTLQNTNWTHWTTFVDYGQLTNEGLVDIDALPSFNMSQFEFNNTYNPTGKVKFYINKELIGRPADPTEDEFTFTLECDDADRAKTDNQELTINGDGDGEFKEIEYGFSDIGKTYTYTIKEKKGSDPNISYHTGSYTSVVSIADNDRDGELEITRDGVATEGNRAKFTNTYNAKDDIKIAATKEYGPGLRKNRQFTFKLEGDGFTTQTKSITGPGMVKFYDEEHPTVEYELKDLKKADGTYEKKVYNYTLSEVIPEDATEENNYTVEGVKYDPHKYHIMVVVSYDAANKQLVKDVYGRVDAVPEETDTYIINSVINETFSNDYTPSSTKTNVAGTKEFTGTLTAGMFTFDLAAADDDTNTQEAIAAGTVVMPAKTSVTNGEAPAATVNDFVFGDIEFKSEGTYKFTVTENTTNKIENVVYSEDIYNVEVTVTYDDNGDLTIKKDDKKITKVGTVGVLPSIGFTNKQTNPGQIPLVAHKDLTGRTLEADQFTFVLKNASDINNDAVAALQTKRNDKDGNVNFDYLEYEFKDLGDEETKVFRYAIKEVLPTGEGVVDAYDESGKKKIGVKYQGYTYDGHIEYVNVTVTKEKVNGEYTGNLIVKSDNAVTSQFSNIEDASGAPVSKVPVFTNEYKAAGKAKISGVKRLIGRRFTEKDNKKLSVQLIDDKTGNVIQTADVVYNGLLRSTLTGVEAEFNFDEIDYDTKGTYTYTVKEIGSLPNVTNDPVGSTDGYKVTVTMTDDGKGHLTESVSPSQMELCFVNNYSAGNDVTFSALKKVNGEVNALVKNKFEFTLAGIGNDTSDTKKNGGDGVIEFKKIEFTQDDVVEDTEQNRKDGLVKVLNDGRVVTVKKYKITENAIADPHFTKTLRNNKEVEYTAEAYIWIKDDGTLGVDKAYFNENGEQVQEASVEFDNTYVTDGKVQLFAQKKLTGRKLEAGKFKFSLYEEDGITPVTINNVPVKASNVEAASGEIGIAEFPEITYDVSDLSSKKSHEVEITDSKRVYAKHYVMKEDHDGAVLQSDGSYKDSEGYTYDGKAYNVVVTLTDDGSGTIATKWYAYSTGTTPDKITVWDRIVEFVTGKNANQNAEFDNYYEAEGAIEITALKKLAGKLLTANEFSFTLTGKDENGVAIEQTKKNDANGNVVFDRINYTKITEEGKPYVYTIKEVVPDVDEEGFDAKRIHYDTTEYTVTVTVTDPGTGKLKVDAVISSDPARNDIPAVTYETDADNTTKTKKIDLCKAGPLVFDNTYKPKPVTITLGGNKVLTGRDIVSGEFSFEAKNASGNPKEYSDTAVNAGNTFTFNKPITFTIDDFAKDTNGVYASSAEFAYEITEVIPADATYDQVKKVWVKNDVTYPADNKITIIVTVTNDGSGVLGVSYKVGENTFTDPSKGVTFINDYDAKNATVFSVQKKLVKDETDDEEYIPEEPKAFHFTLTGTDIETPLTATAYSDGKPVDFAQIDYKLSDLGAKNGDGTYGPKTYTYTVSEVKEDLKGYTYSKEIYNATVVVSSDGKSPELNVERTVTYKDENGSEKAYGEKTPLVFKNKYKATGELEIEGKKTFVANEALTANQFEFALSESATGKKDTYTEIDSVGNAADGSFKFTKKYSTKDIGKTFYYQVNEKLPANYTDTGIDYDETVYSIEVTVVDNHDGTLGFIKKVNDETKDKIIVPFINKKVLPGSVVLEATKSLEGKALEENMFSFVLEGDDIESQTKQNKSNADGNPNVFFDTISYELKQLKKNDDGTYSRTFHYTIKELGRSELGKTEDDGIEYNYEKKLYDVYVDVKVENGKMTVGKPVYKADGTIVSGAVFKNRYVSSDDVEIGGHKILSGFVDGSTPIGEYTFELFDEKGNVVWLDKDGRIVAAETAGATKQSVSVTPKNAKDMPEYNFGKIVFNQDDYLDTAHPDHKFKFRVKEQIPATPAPNVTYAYLINEYNVTVELSYDAKGLLKATAYDDRNAGLKNLDFTNVYNAEGTVQFGGEKEVKGKNVANNAYEFNLYDLGKDGTATPDKAIESVKNNGTMFTFKAIPYTQEDIGTHFYKITETASTADGTEYDHSEYTIKVTIGEGTGDGKLDIKKEITYVKKDKNDKVEKTEVLGPNDVIKFTNNYEAYADLDIEGIKYMYNQPLFENDFKFVLKDETGKEIATVSHEYGALNNIDDLEAQAKFTFSHENIPELNFSHKDFELSDGVYSEKPITKYFIIEEKEIVKEGAERVYKKNTDYESYIVEVTLKANATDKLDKTVRIFGDNLMAQKKDNKVVEVIKQFKNKFTGAGNDEIIFRNEYDSECVIDPPILRKQMVGKDIERGEFRFKIEGPGLRSAGQDWKNIENGYSSIVMNGYASDGVSTVDAEGKPIPEGEIYVGDIKYHFVDLIDPNIDPTAKDLLLQKGKAERTFVYYAYELAPGEEDYKGEDGVDYAFAAQGRERQKFKLVIKAKDLGNRQIELRNGRDEVVDFKNVNFFWEPLSQYALTDTDMSDTFLNTFNREGSIDIEGIKDIIGREITSEDVFEFKITDNTVGSKYYGQSATVENTSGTTGNGALTRVVFAAKKIENGKEVDNIPFLNYKYGAFLEDDGVTLNKVDDRGEKTYIIEETDKYDNAYPGIVRDKSKFKVVVSVTEDPELKDKHGHLNTAIKAVYKIDPKSGVETYFDPKTFEFDNTFEAKGKINFPGIKYLKDQAGNALASPDAMLNQYGFALYQYKDAATRAQTTGKGQGTLIDEQRTDDKGAFTLDIPEYDQEVMKNAAGKYEETKTLYYRIIETKPSNGKWYDGVFESEGVIYDNTEYNVDVTLTLEKDANGKYTGRILTKKDIKEAGTDETKSEISFTNIVREYTVVEGNKYWIDNFKDPSKRPTVHVNLYSVTASGVTRKINSYAIVAPDTTYRFATDSEGNKLPTTDSAGRPIRYEVEEEPIEGYLSEQVNYDFYNTAGDVLIRKIDADTRAPLSGAELAIMDGSTEVERWTSGASAHVVEAQLTAGKTYTLREISAPEGYGMADDMTFTVPSDGSDITVTMSDPPIIGSVRLVKRDAATRDTLAGAEFALYTDAGARIFATGSAGSYTATTTTSNGVFVTDASGALTISNLPYGTYYFVETKAPEGYTLSSERLGFTILRGGELVEVTYLNTKAVGSVRLRKVGSAGTRGLAGAVFELYAATPRSIGQAASSTVFTDAYYRYGTYRTNSAGEIYVEDLPWDDYYFVEVDAPEGYEVMRDVNGDDLVYTFTISEATTSRTISLGDIVNNPEETTPPPRGVLGERVKKGGVVNGVLGVRAKPNSGVLGERIGPVTGDASNIILWSLLLAACIATIVATIMTGKKKKTAVDK